MLITYSATSWTSYIFSVPFPVFFLYLQYARIFDNAKIFASFFSLHLFGIIAFPSFSPYFCSFFSIRVPVPSASARKILTRLRLKNHPGCLFRDKEKTACLDFSSQTVQNVIKSSYVTQSLRIFLTLTLQPSLIPRVFLFSTIIKAIDWPCKIAYWPRHACCGILLRFIIWFHVIKSLF